VTEAIGVLGVDVDVLVAMNVQVEDGVFEVAAVDAVEVVAKVASDIANAI
jgi:hypothetical protein